MVGRCESVSGDLGAERLQAGVSTMPRLRGILDVSPSGRDEGEPRMTRRLVVGMMALVMLAGSSLVLAVRVRAAALGPGLATRSAIQATGNPTLVLDTAKGTIEIELLRGDAPKSVDYIVALVQKNFYRGLRFHRVEPSLVQVGDAISRDVSKKEWWGRSGSTVPAIGVGEIAKKLIHVPGTGGVGHT